MQSSKYFVYEHWRPDKNICFYVGKGKEKRVRSLIRRENDRHCRIRAKLIECGMDIEVKIIGEFLEEKDAFILEIETIKKYRDIDVDLVNFTLGGEGSSGHMHSIEARNKISNSLKNYDRSSVKKRSLSDEHKKNISNGLKGRVVSEETKVKISAAQKGKFRPELVGRKLSDDGLLRLKNRVFTENHREKISSGNKGKVRSEETKKKISDSVKLSYARRRAG